MLNIVTIKFKDPKIDDIPVKCKAAIAQSTATVGIKYVDRGGYKVQPVAGPEGATSEFAACINAIGINQKLMLFNLGNAISVAPTIIGMNQFPNPDISTGITEKNIIITACAVIKAL